ncbi:MAG: hypothetical protein CL674_11245 [Bdellovibrionaceae bacterium]|nr:hypothetical protein [Pseudobdellovibrionaceae bacterium]
MTCRYLVNFIQIPHQSQAKDLKLVVPKKGDHCKLDLQPNGIQGLSKVLVLIKYKQCKFKSLSSHAIK